ncbi:hypothetical protein GT037_010745, partial [Alternaria burnsii]
IREEVDLPVASVAKDVLRWIDEDQKRGGDEAWCMNLWSTDPVSGAVKPLGERIDWKK